MAELKQDPTHPLKHEQCYLCLRSSKSWLTSATTRLGRPYDRHSLD